MALSDSDAETQISSTRLRIGIDGWHLLRSECGPGRYITELCRHLDTLMPNATFFIYSPEPVEAPIRSDRWVVRTGALPMIPGKRSLWTHLSMSRLCDSDRLDALWCEAPLVPKLKRPARIVVTVHDLRHLLVPEMLSRMTLWYYRRYFPIALRRADAIAAVSAGTADRLLHAYGHRASAVVSPGVSHVARRSYAEIGDALAYYKIKSPYLFSLTSWLPNKQTDLLIESFAEMKRRKTLREYSLVIAGSGPGMSNAGRRISSDARYQDVKLLGYVPDDHLSALYSGAGVFVFPSRYEGYGIPVAEARACGARVVAGDIPELREAGGDDAVYVEPTSQGIAAGILSALEMTPPPGRDASRPTWEAGASVLARALSGDSRISRAA